MECKVKSFKQMLKSTYDYISTICYVWLIMISFFIVITFEIAILIGFIFPVLILIILHREKQIKFNKNGDQKIDKR